MSGLGVALALRQRSPEWHEARRALITGTAIPVLLGISPWKCEADLADEMTNGTQTDETVRMRIGSALEDLNLAEYQATTGKRAIRFRAMVRHRDLEWAAASPDARVVGERRLVELKWTTSRTRFADGLPQDVEAQVAWQLGCTGFPVADVSVLTPDGLLPIVEVPADPALFADLVAVAQDFRRRLAAGGPFAQSADSLKRRYPADNGAEMVADAQLDGTVHELLDTRASRKRLEANEEALESAIKGRMGEFASLRGEGWHVTWKRTKDTTTTDWKSLAAGLLATLPETDRDAVVGLNTTVRMGFRPLRVVLEKEGTE